MRRYLICLSIFLFPFSAFANEEKPAKEDIAIEQKFSTLEEAEKHRDEALKFLNIADNMTPMIPNLQDRKHMNALIASVIESITITDMKVKVIAIGLTLLGSLYNDIYDKYCEYKLVLIHAEYHLEMMKFYNGISMNLTNRASNMGDRYFLKAIDCLTMCDKLEKGMTNESDSDGIRPTQQIGKELRSLKKYFISEFKKSKGKITKTLSPLFEDLYELLDIWCDEDRKLFERIVTNVNEAAKYVVLAEEYWGINEETN